MFYILLTSHVPKVPLCLFYTSLSSHVTKVPLVWHRGKLPFEIPNFAKFCHKNMDILPQKFKNLPNFAIKIDKFWKLSVLIGELFIVPGGPEYYIDKKAHKKSLRCISERKKNKNINLIPKQSTKTCRERHQNVIRRNIQV